MTKQCICGRIVLPFTACTGDKCKACKEGRHKEQQYCESCASFTCTGHRKD